MRLTYKILIFCIIVIVLFILLGPLGPFVLVLFAAIMWAIKRYKPLTEEEKRRKEEEITEKKRRMEEKIAEVKRKEEEEIAEEKRRKEEKIAEEKRRKEEEKAEEKRILEELFAQAHQNDHKVMYELAKYYYEGNRKYYYEENRIEQNYVEAMYWIYQAEALGNTNAPVLRKSIEKKASTIHIKAAQKKLSEEFKDIVVVKDEKIDLIKVKDYLLKKFK